MGDSADPGQLIDRVLALELVRVTERTAVAAARLRGRGDERAADEAAVEAMHHELGRLSMDGTIVIGEGARDEASRLFVGETVGAGTGPKVDVAVDPLEGTTLCAKDMPGAIALMAVAETGTLLRAPTAYMQKLAIGPGYRPGVIALDASPEDTIRALAREKGVAPHDITALILDRPRHAEMIAAVRATGAAIRLITDGDIAGVIVTATPERTGIDVCMGVGGAAEGVLAAAALRCVGGQMLARLILDSPGKRTRAAAMGIEDLDKVYCLDDMVAGDVIVAATGVTDGSLLSGVRFGRRIIETETVLYRSATGTVRRIRTEHRDLDKFCVGEGRK